MNKQQEWVATNLTASAFFKCTRWQEELTSTAGPCLFHYSCESFYRGDYPPVVDTIILSFNTLNYLLTLLLTIANFKGSSDFINKRRFMLASGPILLPITLLILSNGNRVNSVFPLSRVAPAILQLVYVSALGFETPGEKSVKYVILESSTASGILHASLYSDSIILPYYTGLDALMKSTFSGECLTCVCRDRPLVVGGELISYKGWSATTFAVVGTLCLRMGCELFGREKVSLWGKVVMEGLGWWFVAWDCVYLVVGCPQVGVVEVVAHGGVLVLIGLHVLRRVSWVFLFLGKCGRIKKKRSFEHDYV